MEWALVIIGVIAVAYGIYKRRSDKDLVKQLLIKAGTVVLLLIIIGAATTLFN